MRKKRISNLLSRLRSRDKQLKSNHNNNKRRHLRTEMLEERRLLASDLLTNFDSSFASSEQFVELNGDTLFVAYDSEHGRELWKKDGLTGITQPLRDINPGTGSSSPDELLRVGNEVFFTADNGSARRLWKTDGSAAGTTQLYVRDGNFLATSITNLTAVGDVIYMSAGVPGPLGVELFKFDTTTSETGLVKNIHTSNFGSSNPSELTDVDGTLFFNAFQYDFYGPRDGNELWKSSGTAANTQMVIDLLDDTRSNPKELTAIGGRVFFTTRPYSYTGHPLSNSQVELWVSDGTEAGTLKLSENTNVEHLTEFNGKLYFVSDDGVHGQELWVSDGTLGGTEILADVRSGPESSQIHEIVAAGNQLFFTANDGVHGRELWRSSGSVGDVQLVRDFFPGTEVAGINVVDSLAPLGNAVFFTAYAEPDLFSAFPENELGLWLSNGQETLRVDDSSDFRPLYRSHATTETNLYFEVENVNGQRQLWEYSNNQPSARFGGPITVTEGSGTILLDATSSIDLDQPLNKFEWDFDYDGVSFDIDAIGSTQSYTQTHDGPITKTVALRVRDIFGATDVSAIPLTVQNASPVISGLTELSSELGETIEFSADVSDAGHLDTLTYHWDLGDGTTSNLASFEHAYASEGEYFGSLTVRDNDGAETTQAFRAVVAPSLQLRSNSVSVTEGETQVEIFVDHSQVAPVDIVVPLTFRGEAIEGIDFETSSQSITIAQGESSASVLITVLDDALSENDEQILIDLGLPSNASFGGNSQFVITILDEDPLPKATITSLGQQVDESGGAVTVEAAISEVAGRDVVLPLAFRGTAAAGVDYQLPENSSIVIPAGSLTGSVELEIVDDELGETSESILIALGAGEFAELSSEPTAVLEHAIIITASDKPSVALRHVYRSVRENAGEIRLEAQLSNPVDQEIQVDFSASGSLAEDEYTIDPANSFVFVPGTTTSEVLIGVIDDSYIYSTLDGGGPNQEFRDETLDLVLQPNERVYVGSRSSFTLNVVDDDRPTLSFSLAADDGQYNNKGVNVWENQSLTVKAELSKPAEEDIVVLIATGNPSGSTLERRGGKYQSFDTGAKEEEDYESIPGYLVIPAGSTEVEFPITLIEDDSPEETELAYVFFLEPHNADLAKSSMVNEKTVDILGFRIRDDDPYVTISSQKATRRVTPSGTNLEEGDSDVITATIDRKSNKDILVNVVKGSYRLPLYGISKASANDVRLTNSDGTESSHIIVQAGELNSEPLTVLAYDDSIEEGREGFTISTTDVSSGIISNEEFRYSIEKSDIPIPPPVVEIAVAFRKNDSQAITVGENSSDVLVDVTLSRALQSDIELDWGIVGKGSAGSPSDFKAKGLGGQSIQIPAGKRIVSFPLDIVDDETRESTESVSLGFVLATKPALPETAKLVADRKKLVLTIRDNDKPASVPGKLALGTSDIDDIPSSAGYTFTSTSPLPLGGCSNTTAPLTLSLCTGSSTFSGSDGALSGATVFVDTNDNGVLDTGTHGLTEFSTLTLRDGSFSFADSEIDTNGDGIFDESDGFLVLSGGTDISTGISLDYRLTAPGGFYSVTPGTSVIAALVKGFGFDSNQAHERFTEAFGIEELDLRTADPLAEYGAGNLLATKPLAVNMQLQSTVHQVVSFLAGLPHAPPKPLVAELVFTDIADKISETNSEFTLTQPAIVKSILHSISINTATHAPDNVVTAAANVIVRGNQLIGETLVAENSSFLDSAVKVQRVANDEVASALFRVANGTLSAEQFTSRYTENAYREKVNLATTGDLLPAVITVSDAVVIESDAGSFLEFTVDLPRPSVETVSVSYATQDGSAVAASDYVAKSGTLTWQPGDTTSKLIRISVNDDAEFESDEHLSVVLSDPQNVALRRDVGTGWIISDDPLSFYAEANSQSNQLNLIMIDGDVELEQNEQNVFSGRFSTGKVSTIFGAPGVADTLSILMIDESEFLASGLLFSGNNDGDQLRIESLAASEVSHLITGPSTGEFVIDGAVIRYSGVSDVQHSLVPTITGLADTAKEGDLLSVQAAVSTAIDVSTTQFTWQVFDANDQSVASSSGIGQTSFEFSPADDGNYELRLTIDANGVSTASASQMIEIDNSSPELTARGSSSSDEGSVYTLDLFSDDPGSDTISQWTIDWGDGSAIETISGEASSATHVYTNGPNAFVPSLTARDEDGTWAVNVIPTEGAIAPDESFGIGGSVGVEIAGSTDSSFNAMDIQPDGRIVAAGQYRDGVSARFVLARFHPDGSLDTSFGTQDNDNIDGLVLISNLQPADSIVVHPNGRIIVSAGPGLYGFDSTGTADNSFGPFATSNGSTGFFTNARDLTVDSQGRIIAAGHRSNYNNPTTGENTTDMILTRFSADGINDVAFAADDGDGRDGVSIIDIGSGDGVRSHDELFAVTLDDQERIVVAGRGSTRRSFATLRYDQDGQLDPTFGAGPSLYWNGSEVIEDVDGIVLTSLRNISFSLSDVVIDSSGRILAGGGSSLIALLPDGTLDTTFHSDGVVGNAGSVLRLIVDGDDNILTIGGTHITKIRPDGSRDPLFGPIGQYEVPGNVGFKDAQVDKNGRILAAGSFRPDGTVGAVHLGLQRFDQARLTVSVNNVAPTLVFNGPDEAIEGQTLSYSFTTTDPGDDTFTIESLSAGPNDQISNVVFDASTGTGSFDVTFADGPGDSLVSAQIADSDGALTAEPTQTRLDSRFGNEGVVVFDIGDDGSADVPYAVAIQADGKALVAGLSRGASGIKATVARFNADGTVDGDFGDQGAAILNFGSAANELHPLSNGRVIVRADRRLIRLNGDGTPDTSFGTQSGSTILPFSSPGEQLTVVLADGRIIAGGIRDNGTLPANGGTTIDFDFALARYLADGTLDSTFGDNGIVSIDLGESEDRPEGLLLDVSDPNRERLVMFGERRVYNPVNSSSVRTTVVTRLDTDGNLDPTYGNRDGFWEGNPEFDMSTATVGANGQVAIVGPDSEPGTGQDFGVLLLSADGSAPDATFGVDGSTTIDMGARSDVPRSIAIDSHRRIIIAGIANLPGGNELAVARLNPDGSLDASFAEAGRHIGGLQSAVDVVADGNRIVVSGSPYSGTGFALAQFTPGSIKVDVANADPNVSVDALLIEVDEGQTATNFGTFSDVLGDTVTMSTDFGTLMQDDATGTWTWSYSATDDLQRSVTIEAMDEDGGATSLTFDLIVHNVAPTATIGDSGPVNENSSVTVFLADPSDPSPADAEALRYSIALDPISLAADYESAGVEASSEFTFPDNGTFNVFGRIYDDDGGVTDYVTSVSVENVAPTFALADETLFPPVDGVFSRTVNFVDPSPVDEHTVQVDWESDGIVDETFVLPIGVRTFELNRVFDVEGMRDVSVTVSDDDDSTNTTKQFQLTVILNTPPTAYDVSGVVGEDGPVVDLVADFEDVDVSDVHTFSIDATATTGMVTNNGDGTFTYDPAGLFESLPAGSSNTDSFLYTVDDGNGGTSTATVTVTINGQNDPALISGLAAGDTNEDSTATVSGVLSVSDIDAGEALFVATSQTGTYGAFAIDADGNWNYVLDYTAAQSLNAGDTVTDSFVVSSVDGTATETVAITIEGLNDQAIISGVATGQTDEDSFANVTGSLVVSDVDDGENVFVPHTNTGGNFGNFSIDATGDWTYVLDHSSVQNMSVNDIETDSFVVESVDGTAAETIVVTIGGRNDTPQIASDHDAVSRLEGMTAQNSGTFADLDLNDSVTLTASVGVVADNGDGTWSWSFETEDSDQTGEVTITATDAQGASASVSFALNVENVAPKILSLTPSEVGGDRSVHLSGLFSDAGSLDSHTIVVDWGEVSDHATNANDDRNQSEGLSVDPREFSFDHQYSTGGIFTVTVTIIDDDGGMVSDSTTRFLVSGVRLDPNSSTLQIVGTSDKDDVKLKSKDKGETIEVDVKLGGEKKQKFEFASETVASIEIFLGDGDDKADLDQKLTIDARIDGGAGKDDIKGGGGSDTLIGGPGDDDLKGYAGDDLLDGGDGDDKLDGGHGSNILLGGQGDDDLKAANGKDGQVGDILVGGDGDDKLHGSRAMDLLIGGLGADDIKGGNNRDQGDILVGGYTTYDSDIASLIAIRKAWTSGNDTTNVVSRLTGVGGLLEANQIVFDDDESDKLHSSKKAIDLFFANVNVDDLKDDEEEDFFAWL